MEPSLNKPYTRADQIPEPLWEDINKRLPGEAAKMTGAKWDGKTFKIPLIGIDYIINPSTKQITQNDPYDHPVSFDVGVVLLTTLADSKGVPPSGRMAVPQELPGGRMFFTGAHLPATKQLAEYFEKNPDLFIRRALEIGGEWIKQADTGFIIPGLPKVPLYILLWHGDKKYPGRALIGIDDRAYFHLDLAGIYALNNILVSRFKR